MKKRGKGRVRQKTSLGSKKTSPDLQDVLFNPQMKNSTGATSLVVPETPTNSSTSMVTGSTFMTVMETPDDESQNIENNCVTNADNETHEHSKAVARDSGKIIETNDDFLTFDITPDLKLGRTRKLLSILESEHSFSKTLQSQQMKNSSMLCGQNNNGRRTKLAERVGMLSPVKGKKRLSLAEVILPFDLNNSVNSSHKLRTIREKEQKPRSVSTPTKPLPTNSRNRFRSQLHSKVDGKVECGNLEVGKGDNLEVGKGENLTLHFDSEDLLLTPVVSSSQQALENTIHGIIEGLESQNLDETNQNGRQPSCLLNDKTQKLPLLSLKKMKGNSRWSICEEVIYEAQTGAAASEHNLKVYHGGSDKAVTPDMPLPDNNRGRMKKDVCDATVQENAKPQPELKSVLSGVVAYVEVRMECDNRSAIIKEHVRALGAEVRDRLTAAVTHVIFRDGSKTVFNQAMKRGLHLVSSLWVEACREQQQRVCEALFPSCSIETYSKPLLSAKLRRLRSMQPKELSEEENLAAARARRRLKAVSSPLKPSVLSDRQFAFPSYNSEKETVNSPLFGIGHLLTPRQRKSVSSTSSEDEENNPEFVFPQNINTPLVERLYDRFFSPKSNKSNIGHTRRQVGLSFDSSSDDVFCGSDEEMSARGRVDSTTLENLKCQLTNGRETQPDESVNLKLSLSNSNNDEPEEMPIRLPGKPSRSDFFF